MPTAGQYGVEVGNVALLHSLGISPVDVDVQTVKCKHPILSEGKAKAHGTITTLSEGRYEKGKHEHKYEAKGYDLFSFGICIKMVGIVREMRLSMFQYVLSDVEVVDFDILFVCLKGHVYE